MHKHSWQIGFVIGVLMAGTDANAVTGYVRFCSKELKVLYLEWNYANSVYVYVNGVAGHFKVQERIIRSLLQSSIRAQV